MKKLLCSLIILALSMSLQATESVVFVHGFMRSSRSMALLAKSFKKEGWHTLNWSYPSRKKRIEAHAEDLVQKLIQLADEKPDTPISFVTHSMGGLITRAALNHPDCPEVAKHGRAVLLAPPNRGAIFGRRLHRYSLVRKLLGNHSGEELLTTPMDGFDRLGNFPEGLDVLIISGTSGANPLIPESNDWVVEYRESCLPTSHFHEKCRSWHSFITFSPEVIRRTKRFLSQKLS
ncbi:MAG: hypothetical protein KR126chlam2_00938 [Chlamydiae bacterium]|nr:hypothetical protein [Chlamydiota bacterium]